MVQVDMMEYYRDTRLPCAGCYVEPSMQPMIAVKTNMDTVYQAALQITSCTAFGSVCQPSIHELETLPRWPSMLDHSPGFDGRQDDHTAHHLLLQNHSSSDQTHPISYMEDRSGTSSNTRSSSNKTLPSDLHCIFVTSKAVSSTKATERRTSDRKKLKDDERKKIRAYKQENPESTQRHIGGK